MCARYLVRQPINVVVAATISASVAVGMVVAMLSLKFRYSYSVVDSARERFQQPNTHTHTLMEIGHFEISEMN